MEHLGKTWGPHIDASLAQVILRFTSVDVSIATGNTYFHMVGKPNMNKFGKIRGGAY